MDKKEITESTKKEVESELERIEEETLKEEFERKRVGKTLEPEAVRIPKTPELGELWPKDQDLKKEDFSSKINDWLYENDGYTVKNLTREVEITGNDTNWIPLQLLDFLIGNAKTVLERKPEEMILKRILEIEVKSIPPKTSDIIILVRDAEGKKGEFVFWADRPKFPAKSVRLFK